MSISNRDQLIHTGPEIDIEALLDRMEKAGINVNEARNYLDTQLNKSDESRTRMNNEIYL